MKPRKSAVVLTDSRETPSGHVTLLRQARRVVRRCCSRPSLRRISARILRLFSRSASASPCRLSRNGRRTAMRRSSSATSSRSDWTADKLSNVSLISVRVKKKKKRNVGKWAILISTINTIVFFTTEQKKQRFISTTLSFTTFKSGPSSDDFKKQRHKTLAESGGGGDGEEQQYYYDCDIPESSTPSHVFAVGQPDILQTQHVNPFNAIQWPSDHQTEWVQGSTSRNRQTDTRRSRWGPSANNCHGIQNSMEAISACRRTPSTEWLGGQIDVNYGACVQASLAHTKLKYQIAGLTFCGWETCHRAHDRVQSSLGRDNWMHSKTRLSFQRFNPFVYYSSEIILATSPSNPPESSHRVWSMNGWKGVDTCHTMPLCNGLLQCCSTKEHTPSAIWCLTPASTVHSHTRILDPLKSENS